MGKRETSSFYENKHITEHKIFYPHHIIQLFGFCVLFISFYRNVRVEWPRSKFNEQKKIVREQVREGEGEK